MPIPSDRRAGLILADSAAAVVAAVVGVLTRFGPHYSAVWEGVLGLPPVSWLAVGFAILTVVTFSVAGVYREDVYWNLRTELKDVLRGLVLLVPTVLSLLYLFKLEEVSRITLGTAFGVLGVLTAGSRVGTRWWARRAAELGRPRARWLVVGSGDGVRRIVDIVQRHPHVGAEVVGYVGDGRGFEEGGWLGRLDELPDVLKSEVVDEVIVVSSSTDPKELEAVVGAALEQGMTVRMPLEDLAPHALRGRVEGFDGVPMWSIVTTSERRVQLAVKRLLDLVGSAVLLVVLSPVFACCAAVIALRDGRPVLFGQRRVGVHGRYFTMWKFRTMVPDAHGLRPGLAHLNEREGPVFKIEDDPRVTQVGKALRKWSMDELPQLWNVIRGEMSLVGPRPQPVEEVEAYDMWHRRRLSMRPGITGLWQVRARRDSTFDTWMAHDLAYIDHWSLWLDFRIAIETPVAAFRMRGS